VLNSPTCTISFPLS